MTFKDVKNNDLLIKRVSGAILRGNVSHAYVFEGACRDKKLLAESFAKAVLCAANPGAGCDCCQTCRKISHGNHEDVIYVEKDGLSIRDEAIEELQGKLKRKPCAGERNIAIIADADTMTKRAQNRLLKTLEEPCPGAVIILLSDNTENLTKTILSRCVVLRWNNFTADSRDEREDKARDAANLILDGASFYRINSKVMEFAESREDAYRMLDSMELLFGEHLKGRIYGRAALLGAITQIEQARRDMKFGMNVAYALKSMILNMEENNGKSSGGAL